MNHHMQVAVLERRLKNIAAERHVFVQPLKSDGRSTLKEDMRYTDYSEAVGSKKTKAEIAAEIARMQALCEALSLLTGESSTQVWIRIEDEIDARNLQRRIGGKVVR